MSDNEPQHDPVPSFAREVLTLYVEAFSDVRFPDLDVDVLSSLTEQVQQSQLEVERLQAELDAARSVVNDYVDMLQTKAERALAYAKVFAEGNAQLRARVSSLGGATESPIAGPGRRRNKRKQPLDAGLFHETDTSAPIEDAAQ